MRRRSKDTWSNHPNSIAVSRYTMDGEYIDSFDSIGLALEQVRLEAGDKKRGLPTSVRKCCEGKAHHSVGYKWSFKDKPLVPSKRRRNVGGKIWAWNKKTGEVTSWKCVADAAEQLLGTRSLNAGIKQSLDSPVERKRSLRREWYFVRREEDVSLIVPTFNDGREQKTPETLLESDLLAAKSASVYNQSLMSVVESPTQPNIIMSFDW